MSVSFKNRIAFHYMVATAIVMAMAFGIIYLVVEQTVIRNLDSDLSFEANKHTGEIKVNGDSIHFKNKAEWEEIEHTEIQVNPVFVQLFNKWGQLMDKSPNLKDNYLEFHQLKFGEHVDAKLNNRAIRQAQIPILEEGEIVGYILAAMSSESAFSVLLKLKNVLIVSYLVLLVGLYFVSRFLAGRGILPVTDVTRTITRITKNNLKERVDLPANEDEIYELSSGFNALLERIENALEREKQFTSDASHELRTPLAAMRGTLEVLVRKPRTQEQYEEKVAFSLKEIDKMTNTLEQLLLLARLDTNASLKDHELISLPTLVDESLMRYRNQIESKNLSVDFKFKPKKKLGVPHYYSDLIIDNVLSNAIKYSKEGGNLKILIDAMGNEVICVVTDEGIGIKESDLTRVFESFYRSDALEHKQIKGNGLGMSIVKKCADAIHATLKVESELGKGTKITIIF